MSTQSFVFGAVLLSGAWLAPAVSAQQPVNALADVPLPTTSPPMMMAAPMTPPANSPTDLANSTSQTQQGNTPATKNSSIPAVTDAPPLPAGSVGSPWTGPGGTGCCGPVGGNGPIETELFLRNGFSMLIQGGPLRDGLDGAYTFSSGARSLFYNCAGDAAWTVEYGVDYFYNRGGHAEIEYGIFGTIVNIREYHRAGVHIAGGREWFVFSPAYQCGTNYRYGFDTGGRWMYSRLNFNNPEIVGPSFQRRSDVMGAFFVALHSDMEVPLNNCTTFITGLRAEWAINYTDVLPDYQPKEFQEIIFSWNLGLRF